VLKMSGLQALIHHGHEKRVQVAKFFGKDETAVNDAAHLLQEQQIESLCPQSERLLDGTMEKKVMTSKGIEWQPRFAVLRSCCASPEL
jgi:hypothetical protein